MTFVRFPADQVEWITPPTVFQSSNRVERGFCPDCGTPLLYRQIDGPNISLTLHSLDDPRPIQPEIAFSPDAAPGWCLALADLPPREMDFSTDPGFKNYQRPRHP